MNAAWPSRIIRTSSPATRWSASKSRRWRAPSPRARAIAASRSPRDGLIRSLGRACGDQGSVMTRKTGRARAGRLPSQRQLRVGEELRHLLAGILGRYELRDPALHDATITVTEVR